MTDDLARLTKVLDKVVKAAPPNPDPKLLKRLFAKRVKDEGVKVGSTPTARGYEKRPTGTADNLKSVVSKYPVPTVCIFPGCDKTGPF